jgi:predicted dehydrogenase
MDKLRFGLCGLGFMGRSHFSRLREHPQVRLVAVCDRDPRRRAGQWDDQLGNLDLVRTGEHVPMDDIRACADTADLVAMPDIDAIVLALPTPLHADVAVAALEAGKHVLCEKPMACDVAACDRMIRAAEYSGRVLMVAQCLRFWPQYETIRRLVAGGRIGHVRFAVLRRLTSAPAYSADNWLMMGATSGGALLDLHVHDIDFMHYAFGMPATVCARGMTGPSGGIDHVVATYSYDDGRYMLLEGGWVLTPPWPFDMSIVVHGERGTLEWAMSRGEAVRLYDGGAEPESIPCAGDALLSQLDHFLECAQAGRPSDLCSPYSTRTSVALAWLERDSIQSGRVLALGKHRSA